MRDRAEARWLPSRYRFSIFKVIAWMAYRGADVEERPGLVLAIDRDQTALENYTVAVFVVITGTCFIAASLPFLPWVLSAIIGLFTTAVILQVLVCLPIGPRASRWRNNVDLKSFITMFILTVAAAWYAAASTWVRIVAWTFVGVLVINGLAFIVTHLFDTE